MNSTDLIYTEDQQEKILEEIKNPQNKKGLPSASLVYSVINLLGIQANMIQELQKTIQKLEQQSKCVVSGEKEEWITIKQRLLILCRIVTIVTGWKLFMRM